MSTHKITSETKIPFPCWLLYPGDEHTNQHWVYETGEFWNEEQIKTVGFTHYSTNPPDQRPEEVRDRLQEFAAKVEKNMEAFGFKDPAPATPSLQSVAEAAAKEIGTYFIFWRGENSQDKRDIAVIINSHFAPLLAQYEQRVRELEGERERLDRGWTTCQKSLDVEHTKTIVAQFEVASLRTRCAELEEDKARIDQIERAQRCIMCLHNEAKNRAVWSVTFENQRHTEYDTLREAMDALKADEDRAAHTKETTP